MGCQHEVVATMLFLVFKSSSRSRIPSSLAESLFATALSFLTGAAAEKAANPARAPGRTFVRRIMIRSYWRLKGKIDGGEWSFNDERLSWFDGWIDLKRRGLGIYAFGARKDLKPRTVYAIASNWRLYTACCSTVPYFCRRVEESWDSMLLDA